MSDSNFVFTIVGKTEHLDRYNLLMEAFHSSLQAVMAREMTRVAEYIRLNKLSGQVLNARSGDLRAATTGSIAASTDTQVVGQVGTFGIPYAKVHELGGAWLISAYQRMQTMAFGKPMIPREVTVRSHLANYPIRSFLRTGANEQAPSVASALQKVMAMAVQHAT